MCKVVLYFYIDFYIINDFWCNFYRRDIVAAFKCFPIDISEVIFPPSILLHRQQLTFHTCELTKDCAEQNITLSHYSESVKMLSEVYNEKILCSSTLNNIWSTFELLLEGIWSSGNCVWLHQHSSWQRTHHFQYPRWIYSDQRKIFQRFVRIASQRKNTFEGRSRFLTTMFAICTFEVLEIARTGENLFLH